MKRQYVFDGTKVGSRRGVPDSKYVKELKLLLKKQQRWLTRVRRAMTAISKIERQIKRLERG